MAERMFKKFYLTYQGRISEPAVTEFAMELPFHLFWSHYLILMRIENKDERKEIGLDDMITFSVLGNIRDMISSEETDFR